MKKLAVGIDIGGTNTVFGLVDRNGVLVAEGSILTNEYTNSLTHYLNDLTDRIIHLINKQENVEIIGVGVGAPSANYYTGIIDNARNLPWVKVIPLQKEISRRLKLPVIITNDANAATIGEMIYGGAKGMKNFAVITLGTGLGSGIVVNGELVYGHDGFAGELGHTIVSRNGRSCGCGRKGCLETYASASGIRRTVFELLANKNENSILRNYSFNKLSSKMISEAATNLDSLAVEAYRYTGEMLGRALSNFVAITSPEAIFLFGGLANSGKHIFEPTHKYMEDNMLFMYSNKVKLLPSQIKKNAAVLGASALAWKEFDNNN